jgi:hypothetical protein
MRVTIDIPDELHQAAKDKAALEGRPLRALFLEGLELALHRPPARQTKLCRATFPIIAGSPSGRVVTNEIVQKALETD